MKLIYTFLLFNLFTFSVFAQKEDNYERIKTLKIGYITEEVSLTAEEAKKFWPIYEKYNKILHDLHTEAKTCRRHGFSKKENLTEKEALEILKKDTELGDKISKISKDKDKELLKVISARKLVLLKNAERDFHRKLMTQYKNSK
ncbi:hypothetical protein [Capnocytophaga canis]|uniref:hypothetical protein n=1 Tax=Capnocytophaga canis TaxID=1848903 RepID=UPI0015622B4C|nr:hypothetical protein [Capnocytophaga canis]GIM60897.1 hypothetical protein CAPN008_09470 [Capnocytophaga canis]